MITKRLILVICVAVLAGVVWAGPQFVIAHGKTANVDEEVWQTIVLGKVKIEKGMELRLRKGDGAALKWIDLKGVYLVEPKVLGMN